MRLHWLIVSCINKHCSKIHHTVLVTSKPGDTMDRLLSPAIAATGLVAGLLLATGYRADAVTPLLLALATAAAVRIYRHRFGQRH